MLSCTNLVKQVAVFIQLTLMVTVPLVSSVTKRQPVGGGQCFRRDWMARVTSIAAEPITKMALVICMLNFGWDWTRYTVLQQL